MKFLKLRNVLLVMMAIATLNTHAQEIAGGNVSEKIVLNNETLLLNGAGVRSKFFIDLYVGSLYLPKKGSTLNAVLDSKEAIIRLNIVSGLISSEKMQDEIEEGFESATNGKPETLKKETDTFLKMFSDEIKKTDQFTFVTSIENGVEVYKNKQLLGTIQGEAFRTALLKIWLGKEPAQTSLKEAMLGK